MIQEYYIVISGFKNNIGTRNEDAITSKKLTTLYENGFNSKVLEQDTD